MKRFQRIFFGILGFSLLLSQSIQAEDTELPAAPAAGELFKLEPIGPPPESQIFDDARLFNAREKTQLEARLEQFRKDQDVVIYVAAYSVLIGEAINERAIRLKDKWLEGKRGIVVVYQRGTERMTFSSTADPENYVRRPVLQEVFAAAFAQASQQERGASRVIVAVDQLMSMIPEEIQKQRFSNEDTASETRGFVAWAIAGMVLLAIGGMVAFHLLRQAQAQVTKSYTFPKVDVPARFGAPYCGGHQAELEFRPSSS